MRHYIKKQLRSKIAQMRRNGITHTLTRELSRFKKFIKDVKNMTTGMKVAKLKIFLKRTKSTRKEYYKKLRYNLTVWGLHYTYIYIEYSCMLVDYHKYDTIAGNPHHCIVMVMHAAYFFVVAPQISSLH